jgi:ribose 5-phosphate isomerase A
MSADAQKRAAGEAAADLVEPGMRVGLGTGSTAAWFVRALAERGLERLRCVPTSEQTAALARELGLPLAELDAVGSLDLTVDGADEVGPGLALIKGAGGALLREKLVWEASARCVCIADAGKRVEALGAAYPLPIEVIPFGAKGTVNRIADVLSEFEIGAMPRLRSRDGAPVLTDSGNLLYDVACRRIDDPAALGAALKSLTGVVEHGLFLDLADEALIGTDEGVVRLTP